MILTPTSDGKLIVTGIPPTSKWLLIDKSLDGKPVEQGLVQVAPNLKIDPNSFCKTLASVRAMKVGPDPGVWLLGVREAVMEGTTWKRDANGQYVGVGPIAYSARVTVGGIKVETL